MDKHPWASNLLHWGPFFTLNTRFRKTTWAWTISTINKLVKTLWGLSLLCLQPCPHFIRWTYNTGQFAGIKKKYWHPTHQWKVSTTEDWLCFLLVKVLIWGSSESDFMGVNFSPQNAFNHQDLFEWCRWLTRSKSVALKTITQYKSVPELSLTDSKDFVSYIQRCSF